MSTYAWYFILTETEGEHFQTDRLKFAPLRNSSKEHALLCQRQLTGTAVLLQHRYASDLRFGRI